MVTIKDIAKTAGVSITTVSKVINNYPDIGQETRDRVIKIMKQANYHPNAIARSLSTNKSNSIGVFLHYHPSKGLHHIFFHEILFSLETVMGKKGYDFIYFSDLKWKRSCDYLDKCHNRHIDGVILMGINRDSNVEDLLQSDIPAVFLDIDVIGENATYITSDNILGARKAVGHFHELGHTDIGMIAGLKNTIPTKQRSRGFELQMEELGLSLNKDWIVNSFYNEEGGYSAMTELLALKDYPTAIFCHSDMIAIGAMKAIKDAGYSIPEDFSIIGFDDLEICNYVSPKLTTIKQDTYLMGEKAAKLLEDMIKDSDKEIEPQILPVELIKRKSCKRN
ncbi:MAG: LacI family DNA-binding transcriptional regulator [Halanaerobiaceae bacterium]